jgi:hypothetical protein
MKSGNWAKCSGKRIMKRNLAPSGLALLLATGFVVGWASRVQAAFSLGDGVNFAVYGFGSGFTDQLQPGAVTVNGNVGVGPGGNSILGGANVVISGQLIYSDPITSANFSASGGPIKINGSAFNLAGSTTTQIANGLAAGQLVQNSSMASQTKTDLQTLYSSVAGLSATAGAPSGALASSLTWNGSGGNNVASLSSFGYSSGDTLTLNGSASDYFIFNISGGWSMSGSANIVLGANVSPDHVLFNLLETANGGTGADVTASGSSTGFGVILALDRNITFDLPGGDWTGRLFSDTDKTIHLFSEATINQPVLPVPEATTFIAGALLLLPLGASTLRILRRKATA